MPSLSLARRSASLASAWAVLLPADNVERRHTSDPKLSSIRLGSLRE
jgi:hypothetical protein